MFSIIYNILLGILLMVSFPIFLLHFNKYKKTVFKRLFFFKKNYKKNKHFENCYVIWIHAVSVGETKAVAKLAKKLKEKRKDSFIIISNITKTGHATAKKELSFCDEFIFLPFDFSYVMKRYVSFFRPKLIIISETDIWYNFLNQAKKIGSKIVLVNGKMSEKSFSKYRLFNFFFLKIYSLIDLFCVQSEEYKQKFLTLGINPEKLNVTGNLKLDLSPKIYTNEQLLAKKLEYKINQTDKVITIASTHEGEEELLLDNIESSYKIFLAPRHPERFLKVAKILERKNISYILYSQINQITGNERVILVDSMGKLNLLYQLSSLVIIGGSFIPSIGGHNILEPTLVQRYVFFGPYMHKQKDLERICLENKCGEKVDARSISKEVDNFFQIDQSNNISNIKKFNTQNQKATEMTLLAMEKYF